MFPQPFPRYTPYVMGRWLSIAIGVMSLAGAATAMAQGNASIEPAKQPPTFRLLGGYVEQEVKPTPLDELPGKARRMRFLAHHFVTDQIAYGEYSLRGPEEETLRPLPPRAYRLVHVPERDEYYAATPFRMFKVDKELRDAHAVSVGLDVPPLFLPCDLAFDSKRGRVIVGTHNWSRESVSRGGYLYAFSPETSEWQVLGKLPEGLQVFSYHERDDCFYGLTFRIAGELWAPHLVKFDLRGEVSDEKPLGEPLGAGSLDFSSPDHGPVNTLSIAAIDDFAAIVSFRGDYVYRGQWRYHLLEVHLVEIATGKAWLTHRSVNGVE